MKIGIFGHSDAVYRKSDHIKTPASILAAAFPDDQIDWFGVSYCSSERLLLLLQKHKNYDLYLIFHSDHTKVYCPAWNKDALAFELRKCITNADFKEKFIKKLERTGNDSSLMNELNFDKALLDNKILMNRWVGALLQIRNFCTDKKTIHIYSDQIIINILNDFYHSNQISNYLKEHRKSLDKIEQSGDTYHSTSRELHYERFSALLCNEINKFKELSSQ